MMQNGRCRIVFCACIVALLLGVTTPSQAASSGTAGGRSSERAAKQKKETLKKVQQSPDIQISFENSEGVPLFINRATVKEISNAEFQQLVGFTTDSDRYSLFPIVTV